MNGCRVLVVDDEALIALDIETVLTAQGCVVAIARDVKSAVSELDKFIPDVAVLDADLLGESSEPVALQLRASAVPFLVVTGFPRHEIDWIDDAPVLTKPFSDAEFLEAFQRLIPNSG